MGFSSFIKSLDTYAQPVSLYHSGRKTIQTYFGALIRLFSYGALAVFIYFVVIPNTRNLQKTAFKTTKIFNRNDSESILMYDHANFTLQQFQDFNVTIVIDQGTNVQRQHAAKLVKGQNLTNLTQEQEFILKDITNLVDLQLVILQVSRKYSCQVTAFDNIYTVDQELGISYFVDKAWQQSPCIQTFSLSQQNETSQFDPSNIFQLDQKSLLIPIQESPQWQAHREYSLNFGNLTLQKEMSEKFHLLNPNIGDSYMYVLEDDVGPKNGSQDTNETQLVNQTDSLINFDQNGTANISIQNLSVNQITNNTANQSQQIINQDSTNNQTKNKTENNSSQISQQNSTSNLSVSNQTVNQIKNSTQQINNTNQIPQNQTSNQSVGNQTASQTKNQSASINGTIPQQNTTQNQTKNQTTNSTTPISTQNTTQIQPNNQTKNQTTNQTKNQSTPINTTIPLANTTKPVPSNLTNQTKTTTTNSTPAKNTTKNITKMASDLSGDLFGRHLKKKRLTIQKKNATVPKNSKTNSSSNQQNSNYSSNQTENNEDQTDYNDETIILGPNKEAGPYQVFAIQALIDQNYYAKVYGRIQNYTQSIKNIQSQIDEAFQIIQGIDNKTIKQDPFLVAQLNQKGVALNQSFLYNQSFDTSVYRNRTEIQITDLESQLAVYKDLLNFIQNYTTFRVQVKLNQNEVRLTEDDDDLQQQKLGIFSQQEQLILDKTFDMTQKLVDLKGNSQFYKFKKEFVKDDLFSPQLKSLYRIGQPTDLPSNLGLISLEQQSDSAILNFFRSIIMFNVTSYDLDMRKYQNYFNFYYENLTNFTQNQTTYYANNPDQIPPPDLNLNWTIDQEDLSFMNDQVAIVEKFLQHMYNQLGDTPKIYYNLQTILFTVDTKHKVLHEKVSYGNFRSNWLEWAVVSFVVIYLADIIIFAPLVQQVNSSVYLSQMIQKLYHRRRVVINEETGVNKIANVVGINPHSSSKDVISSSTVQREKIQVSWFNILTFKCIKCSKYKWFKGMQYYNGKMIYEGEQRLKNEGDIGNLVQLARKCNTFTSSMLGSRGYYLMKFQQQKFIDIIDNTKGIKFVDQDSNANNQASLEDARDFTHFPAIYTGRESLAPLNEEEDEPKDADDLINQGHSRIEMQLVNQLNVGVIRNNTANAKSLKAIRTGTDGLK